MVTLIISGKRVFSFQRLLVLSRPSSILLSSNSTSRTLSSNFCLNTRVSPSGSITGDCRRYSVFSSNTQRTRRGTFSPPRFKSGYIAVRSIRLSSPTKRVASPNSPYSFLPNRFDAKRRSLDINRKVFCSCSICSCLANTRSRISMNWISAGKTIAPITAKIATDTITSIKVNPE